MNKRIYVKGQGKIFENGFLERLTKSNPKKTIVFYSLVISAFIFLSIKYTRLSISETIELYVSGLFTWTLMEYLLHRFVFHIDEYFPVLKRFHYIVHGVHHEHPGDHERLFMPPVPGLIIAVVMFFFLYLFVGLYAFAFMAGISNGYLIYSYIHYNIHSMPANPFFHRPWSHHAKHHFKYPDKAFGVSSPIWDLVFRTMPPKNQK